MVTVTFVNADGTESVIAEQGREGYEIISCETTVGLDTVSSATISIPATNKMKNLLFGRNPTVAIYKDQTRVFIGSVASPVTEDVFGNVKASLDGALSWLGDVAKPPFKVEASSALSVTEYLSRLATQYNAAVGRADRQIQLGGVTVSGTVVVTHSTEYSTMLDLFREIREIHGGHFVEVFGGRGDLPRIDYIEQPTIKNPKPLLFGENLSSLESNVTYDHYASRICAANNNGLTYTATNSEAESVFGRVDYPLSSNAETLADMTEEADAVLADMSNPIRQVTAEAVGNTTYLQGQLVDLIDPKTGMKSELTVLTVATDWLSGKQKITAGREHVVDFTASVTRSIASGQTARSVKTELSAYDIALRAQDSIRFAGTSRFRMKFVQGTTEMLINHGENYQPMIILFEGQRTAQIIGDFEISTGAQIRNWSTVLFTGLPKPSQNWYIHDCLTWTRRVISNGVVTQVYMGTASAVLNKNGELLYLSPDGLAPTAGTTIHIDAAPFSTMQFKGEYAFPTISSTDIAAATAWIQNHRGQFSYTNSLGGTTGGEIGEDDSGVMSYDDGKNDAATSGRTDCSGLIFNAFYHSTAAKRVPNFASAQCGYGDVVQIAGLGKPLSMVDMRKGDLVCYIRPNQGYAHHVAYYDGQKLWHQNIAYDANGHRVEAYSATIRDDPAYDASWEETVVSYYENGEPVYVTILKGPQPISDPRTYLSTNNVRMVVRWSEESKRFGANLPTTIF